MSATLCQYLLYFNCYETGNMFMFQIDRWSWQLQYLNQYNIHSHFVMQFKNVASNFLNFPMRNFMYTQQNPPPPIKNVILSFEIAISLFNVLPSSKAQYIFLAACALLPYQHCLLSFGTYSSSLVPTWKLQTSHPYICTIFNCVTW